jgi:hypothetical protein
MSRLIPLPNIQSEMFSKTSKTFRKRNTNEEEYAFPYYFQAIFNFLFFVCLSPIYVEFPYANSTINVLDSVKLREFPLQKVSAFLSSNLNSICKVPVRCIFWNKAFCTLIHIILWLSAGPLLRGNFVEKIKEHPVVIFRLFSYLTWVGFFVVLTWTFWKKKEYIRDLIGTPPRTQRNWKA